MLARYSSFQSYRRFTVTLQIQKRCFATTMSTLETVQKAVIGGEKDTRTPMEKFADSVEETKVTYRRLGTSGLKVSVPILGAMSFGSPEWAPWVKDESVGLPLLKAAYDRGLNTWDTANVYSNGESEKIIAKAIKTYKIPREKLTILTKCFFATGDEPGFSGFAAGEDLPKSKDFVNRRGLSRAAIFNQVDASLRRLETDYIDLLQIHRFDPDTPVEETMKALHDLVQSGKVRYIGASSMWAYQFALMQFTAEKHGWTKFVSMQNHYNMLYREEEREMIPFCNATGVGLIPWAPLARGHLARPREDFGSTARSSAEAKNTEGKSGHSDVDLEVISRVQKIAEAKGWKMTHVSLAWILRRVTSPIIGFSSVERIDEALGVRGKELTDEEDKQLSELYKPVAVQGHS